MFKKLFIKNEKKLEINKEVRILDLGCGTGVFAKVFQDSGYNILGVDVAPKMVKIVKKNGINVIIGDN